MYIKYLNNFGIIQIINIKSQSKSYNKHRKKQRELLDFNKIKPLHLEHGKLKLLKKLFWDKTKYKQYNFSDKCFALYDRKVNNKIEIFDLYFAYVLFFDRKKVYGLTYKKISTELLFPISRTSLSFFKFKKNFNEITDKKFYDYIMFTCINTKYIIRFILIKTYQKDEKIIREILNYMRGLVIVYLTSQINLGKLSKYSKNSDFNDFPLAKYLNFAIKNYNNHNKFFI